MIGKPKVMICIGMICLGAFLIHSSDIRAAELRECEVEEELREDEDADTEIVFDADTAINRTAAKSALADLHGVFVFRDAFIRQEQIVKSQQKQNYEKMEQIVLTKQQPDSGYEELVDLVLNSDDTKYIKDMYYMEDSHQKQILDRLFFADMRDELRKQQMQIEDSKTACQIQIEQKE